MDESCTTPESFWPVLASSPSTDSLSSLQNTNERSSLPPTFQSFVTSAAINALPTSSTSSYYAPQSQYSQPSFSTTLQQQQLQNHHHQQQQQCTSNYSHAKTLPFSF